MAHLTCKHKRRVLAFWRYARPVTLHREDGSKCDTKKLTFDEFEWTPKQFLDTVDARSNA